MNDPVLESEIAGPNCVALMLSSRYDSLSRSAVQDTFSGESSAEVQCAADPQ
jgi:hypothetical protein